MSIEAEKEEKAENSRQFSHLSSSPARNEEKGESEQSSLLSSSAEGSSSAEAEKEEKAESPTHSSLSPAKRRNEKAGSSGNEQSSHRVLSDSQACSLASVFVWVLAFAALFSRRATPESICSSAPKPRKRLCGRRDSPPPPLEFVKKKTPAPLQAAGPPPASAGPPPGSAAGQARAYQRRHRRRNGGGDQVSKILSILRVDDSWKPTAGSSDDPGLNCGVAIDEKEFVKFLSRSRGNLKLLFGDMARAHSCTLNPFAHKNGKGGDQRSHFTVFVDGKGFHVYYTKLPPTGSKCKNCIEWNGKKFILTAVGARR